MDSGKQTTVTDSPGASAADAGLFRFLPEIQVIEILMAIFIFVSIHSLRQGRRQGLVVWPVVGMLPSLLLGIRKDMYEWITSVLDGQGGTFVFRGPWFTNLHCVVTADPRNLEHLLKVKFPNFPKGEYFRSTVCDLLGDGIFSADDETWRRQRKTASLEFHSAEFRSMTAQSLVELIHSRLLPVLAVAEAQRAPIDLQDVLLRLTFDNVCMIAFGTDPGCLRPGLPEIPFAKAFEDATEATTIRFITPTAIWKALRYFDLGSERWLRRSIAVVDEFAYEVIRTRREELSSGEQTRTARSDLLTVFTKLRDEDGTPYSDKFLRDVCVNFILAGRDTSSVALAWFFWLLNRHPEVEERILGEIRKITEERGGDEDGELVFKPEEVKRMEYLHAALSEALRLYPSVPVDHKEVVEDDVFPDGTVLKKGTKVIYAIFSMGRMESIWGKDCRDFKPERWLKDGRFMSESAYKFTAFNGGPRLCLGKDFAYYQMKFVAGSILHRYHVKVMENHPVVPKMALTMYMKYGLKVTLCARDGTKVVGK
ncbi:LEM3 (ligand-effect modulator 3) family / CDC50 family [Musa troglodytarum]|uniref:LEM3 (Ligand-effect modulator 3) family / CDC50 family n=1 Tax=Musa troglodytarum TaxID=320322 RepID=A0A9E7F4G0_9LILI|nr:LEM3 (ligand-effect modulator 3) family / CDC50 family [Musa troglodytarum]